MPFQAFDLALDCRSIIKTYQITHGLQFANFFAKFPAVLIRQVFYCQYFVLYGT